MFQRLRIWLTGQSGLREATREAAREATREGLTEGFRLGVDDFIGDLTAITASEPTMIEAETNGQTATAPRLTAAELRGKRKAELIDLAAENGIDADDSWTVAELRDALTE